MSGKGYGWKSVLILMGLGAGAVLGVQHWLDGSPRQRHTVEMQRPQSSGRTPVRELPASWPEARDISVRIRSVAAEASAHIACTGHAITNAYIGGASMTSLDCEGGEPIADNDYIGNIAAGNDHE